MKDKMVIESENNLKRLDAVMKDSTVFRAFILTAKKTPMRVSGYVDDFIGSLFPLRNCNEACIILGDSLSTRLVTPDWLKLLFIIEDVLVKYTQEEIICLLDYADGIIKLQLHPNILKRLFDIY